MVVSGASIGGSAELSAFANTGADITDTNPHIVSANTDISNANTDIAVVMV